MSDKIAIVGLAGRFPAASDVRALWRLLAAGEAATNWPGEEELLAAGVLPSELEHPDYVRATLTLPHMECFDAGFFGLSPKEAAIMDPQHRHFIECCWEALEDAGCVPAKFKGAIGVYGGCGMQAYMALNLLANRALMAETGMFLVRHTGNDKDFLTTRASYLMGLTGPSIGVQTACSTSLVAVHLACQSLLSGESDLALAGGVSIELPHRRGYRHVENEILSRDGLCRAFDNDASGTLFGSGACVVALRRLDDALADGDNIHAVILATAVNNDGASKAGYLAPSVSGQARAAAEALAIANLEPHQIDYIEAHGTGTVIGDPIELAALTEAYGSARGSHRIGIGSIKTNIGHLDTAAGAAGLIKVVLALKHEFIPRTLHYSTPNSRFDLAASPFAITDTERAWGAVGKPRRGAVNSLGVGGTNAHVIVEEAPRTPQAPQHCGPELFMLSAKTMPALARLRSRWQRFSEDAEAGVDLANAAFTSREGRTAFAHREVAVASSFEELSVIMKAPSHRQRASGAAASGARIVFMYPGGGAQYPGAAKGLYLSHPAFREACDSVFALMPKARSDMLRHLMLEDGDINCDKKTELLQRPSNSVTAVFVLEYALTRMWEHWGIKPAMVIGHSAGDYAAAVTAGVMSLQDALACIDLRGDIFERMPAGGMLVIGAGVTETREFVGPSLDIAATNGPELTVVSGPAADIDRIAGQLSESEIVCQRVPIRVAAHSRALDPYLEEFRAHLSRLALSAPKIPFMSNLDGRLMSDVQAVSADFWCRHLRETVRFGDGLSALLTAEDCILVEVGPGQALSAIAKQATFKHPPRAIVPSTRHINEVVSDEAFALLACGRLWANGAEPDLAALRNGRRLRRVSAPTYAFERQRHWIDAAPIERVEQDTTAAKASSVGSQLVCQRIADTHAWFSKLEWQHRPAPASVRSHNRQQETWVLIGDEPHVAAIGAELRRRGRQTHDVKFAPSLSLDAAGHAVRPGNLEDYSSLIEALRSRQDTINQFVVILCSNEATLEERALDVFTQAFHLLKALVIADWDRELDVSFITAGAWSVDDGPAADPAFAAALGPVCVIGHECATLRARVVDVSANVWIGAQPPDCLIDELGSSVRGPAVALRQSGRFQFEYSALHAKAVGAFRVRDGGTYLMTGAAGGIARLLAQHLAKRHGAQLALIAREPVPERTSWPSVVSKGGALARYIRHLIELEALGCRILPLAADVTSAADMARAVAMAREAFGPLHGVFHLAGRIDDALIAAKTIEDAAAVMRPKVDGTAILDRLLPDGSIELFAVMSSVSTLIGPPGQSDYIAANAVQDSIASARSDGLVMTSGIWGDVGMAARPTPSPRGARSEPALDAHPLLGTSSRRGPRSTTFCATYQPDTIGFLDDHRINGTAVLPGVAYLEISRGAMAAMFGPDIVIDLANANILAPMAFPDDHARVVTTAVEEASPTTYRISISSSTGATGADTLHFEATVSLSEANRTAWTPMPIVRLESRPERAGARLKMAQHDGIAFGPRFDVLAELEVAEGQSASAVVQLKPQFASELADLAAHPALVDIASTVGLFTLSQARRKDALFVPLSIRRVSGLCRLPARFSVRATLHHSSTDDVATFDVVFADADGLVLLRLEQFSLKAIDKDSIPDLPAERSLLSDVLQAGLRRSDAACVFDHVLSTTARNVMVSSIGLPTLRSRFRPPARKAILQPVAAADVVYEGEVEPKLAAMMGELLGIERVAPHDDFFAMGGQSITAVRLFAKIRREWNVDLPLATLFQAPNVRALAKLLTVDAPRASPNAAPSSMPASSAATSTETAATGSSIPFPGAAWSPLVTISAGRPDHLPIYCIHGAGGNVLSSMPLSKAIGTDVRFIGLQARGVDGLLPPLECIEEMARSYLTAIRAADPDGPRCVIGYSGGGVIAYEMCRLLQLEGRQLDLCVMIDTLAPNAARRPSRALDWAKYAIDNGPRAFSTQFASALQARMTGSWSGSAATCTDITEMRSAEVFKAYMRAQSKYRADPIAMDVLLFRATRGSVSFHRAGRSLGWDDLILGRLEVVDIDADHDTIVAPASAAEIARLINAKLSAVAEAFARSTAGTDRTVA